MENHTIEDEQGNDEQIIKISETFMPNINDGYALIQSVTTTSGKRLLHEMKILLPEGSVTAILGPSGAGKSTLLNTLTDSLSITSTAVADSKYIVLLSDPRRLVPASHRTRHRSMIHSHRRRFPSFGGM